jgi:DNA mismatch repair ATPase MutS
LPAKVTITISLRINYQEAKTLIQKHKLENSGKKGINKFLKTFNRKFKDTIYLSRRNNPKAKKEYDRNNPTRSAPSSPELVIKTQPAAIRSAAKPRTEIECSGQEFAPTWRC